MMFIKMENIIRILRKEKKLSQEDLAKFFCVMVNESFNLLLVRDYSRCCSIKKSKFGQLNAIKSA